MLTIDDIKNVGFRRAKFGGYKPEDVDAFIDDIQISFEKMTHEMKKLNETVRNLSNQIRKFKEEDESIKNVISSAKQVAEKSIDDARNHTTSMLTEAAKKSEDMINNAKKEVEINREISERLKSESAKLRQKLDDIYKRHLEIISEIPADVLKEVGIKESDAVSDRAIEDKPASKVAPDNSEEKKWNHSDVRKRFFEIDVNAAKESNSRSYARSTTSGPNSNKNFFSSDEKKAMHLKSKFQNLQFGKNFDITGEGSASSSTGAYSGIFKK